MWLFRDGKNIEYKGTLDEFKKSSLPGKGWILSNYGDYRPDSHILGAVSIIKGKAVYDMREMTEGEKEQYAVKMAMLASKTLCKINLSTLLKDEKLRFHGVDFNKKEGCSYLNFGILHLLNTIHSSYSVGLVLDGDNLSPAWHQKWLDRKFGQAVRVYQGTFHKFNQAVFHLTRCVEDIKLHSNAEEMEDYSKHLGAVNDIPLYLDLILIYLRIHADCLANVIPNFYGKTGEKQSIPRDSFRDHIKWFTKKNPTFDPTYKEVLETNIEWFNTLVGPGTGTGQGLRDILMHYRGAYHIQWPFKEGEEFYFKASMYNESKVLCENLIEAIISMVADYFKYLEKIYIYFLVKLREEIDVNLFPHLEKERPYITFKEPSYIAWIYPVIHVS